MPKTFITEHDIQDLYTRGTRQLSVNDEVVLTDLAYERALKLGVELKRGAASPATAASAPAANNADLARRVKAAVLARVGGAVDEKLLDAVIANVLAGVK
jgi:hypothetical protein